MKLLSRNISFSSIFSKGVSITILLNFSSNIGFSLKKNLCGNLDSIFEK